MRRSRLEVADIFRDHGAAWRTANAGHLSLGQLKVMSAIERCRTAAMGGHVTACEDCDHRVVAYNSCRDRHCPKCQGAAARTWLAEREAELLPVGYFHLVFTLPKPIADIAYQNKRVIYDLLFKASAEAMLTIAADPKHLGARIGFTSVLHSWGSAMTHHPHIHMIVPGGGISMDGARWVSCRPNFFLPVRVLSRLFRGLILKGLKQAHADGRLQFFNDHRALADKTAFDIYLQRLHKTDFAVHAKEPFAGPKAVLAYLSRYTHRVAIANRRLISVDDEKVTFTWKDYRAEGAERYKVMTLDIHEFIRRFLIHVFPKRFHRIRHYGLLANGNRADNVALARRLLAEHNPDPRSAPEMAKATDERDTNERACPACSGRMIIIETFEPGAEPSAHHQRGPPEHRDVPSSAKRCHHIAGVAPTFTGQQSATTQSVPNVTVTAQIGVDQFGSYTIAPSQSRLRPMQRPPSRRQIRGRRPRRPKPPTSIPISPGKPNQSSTPRFPALALVRRGMSRMLNRPRCNGVRLTCT